MSATQSATGVSIRRWYHYEEETLTNEAGIPADGDSVRKVVIGCLFKNPAVDKPSPASLQEEIDRSPALGEIFAQKILAAMGGQKIASYGKSCVVGMRGEYEHGNAFLTESFMNPIRSAIGGGKAWVPSSGKRGSACTTIDIPLANKDALYVRAQYDTVTVTFPDGPADDEILLLFAVATRGRLHARLGGLQAADVKGEDGLR
ncbi:amino acid synthesis family protein [Bordetella sp. 2513F-2]